MLHFISSICTYIVDFCALGRHCRRTIHFRCVSKVVRHALFAPRVIVSKVLRRSFINCFN